MYVGNTMILEKKKVKQTLNTECLMLGAAQTLIQIEMRKLKDCSKTIIILILLHIIESLISEINNPDSLALAYYKAAEKPENIDINEEKYQNIISACFKFLELKRKQNPLAKMFF